MASKSNDYREMLARAHKEVRAALKDCELLLERTRKTIDRIHRDRR